jgi:hypothetical protein
VIGASAGSFRPYRSPGSPTVRRTPRRRTVRRVGSSDSTVAVVGALGSSRPSDHSHSPRPRLGLQRRTTRVVSPYACDRDPPCSCAVGLVRCCHCPPGRREMAHESSHDHCGVRCCSWRGGMRYLPLYADGNRRVHVPVVGSAAPLTTASDPTDAAHQWLAWTSNARSDIRPACMR